VTDYVGANFDEGEMIGEGVVITCKAGGAITKGRFVKLSDATDLTVTQISTAGDPVLGVAMKAASAAGEYIPVCIRGVVKMKLGTVTGTLAAGSAVDSDANGQPDAFADQAVNEGGTATYTIYYNRKAGVTLQSGVTGDLIMVLMGK